MIFLYTLYPYLYVLIPILFLYKMNIYEISVKKLLECIFVITLIYAITYIILIQIFDISKSSIIIFNIFIYLYNFTKIIFHSIIKPIKNIKKVSFFQWLFASAILVFTYFSIFYNFDIKIIEIFTKIMFGILLFINIVVLFNIINIKNNIRKTIKNIQNNNLQSNIETIENNTNIKNPNIYFIIPDSYPGWESLKEYANFDNEDFLNFLKENNFNIIENSFSNYRSTFISLPSILNMQYLDNFIQKNEDGSMNNTNIKIGVEHKYLYDYLIKKNYKITEVFGKWNKCIESVSAYKEKINTIYFQKYDYVFIAKLFSNNSIIGNVLNSFDYKQNVDAADSISNFLQNNELSNSNNFVIAHIMLPHPPYIINDKLHFSYLKTMKYMDPQNFFNDFVKNASIKDMINQIKYTNNILQTTIEAILQKDPNSVIIVHSDHGNHMTNFIKKKSTDNKDYDKTHYNIIRAIYFKGDKINIKSNTSVNTFREIFNILFNDNIKILEEKIVINEPYMEAGWTNKYFYDVNIEDL